MGVLGVLGTKIKNSLKYPSLHLEADTENCTKCRKCSKSCEMSIAVNELVQSGDMYHPDIFYIYTKQLLENLKDFNIELDL